MTRRLLVFLCLFLSLGCSFKPAVEPVYFGHVAPFTGPDKAHGERSKQGITLAVEEANEDTARNLNKRLVFLHADSAGSDEAAVAQADRLATVNRVVALLTGTEPGSPERLARAAGPNGVPLLTAAELPPLAPGEYVFSLAATPGYEGRVLATYATENLKANNVIVLTDSTSPVKISLAAAFIRELSRESSNRVEEVPYKVVTDITDLPARLERSGATAILVAGSARDLIKVKGQLQTAKSKAVLLFGGEEGAVPDLLDDGSAGPSVFVTTVFAPEGLTDQGKELAKKYRERFGRDLNAQTALAYDGARLLFEGLRRAKVAYGPRIRDELAKVEDWESLTGPLTFTAERSARRPVFVVEVKPNEAKMSRRFDPEPK